MVVVLKAAVGVFALDFLTKISALRFLQPCSPRTVIPGFFNLSLVFNRGAAFGIFPGAATVFMILAAATIVAIFFFAWRSAGATVLSKIALGLIAGGASGNLLDRIRFGHVVDFLDFYLGPWHWPAFNIADSSLCLGASFILITSLRKHSRSF